MVEMLGSTVPEFSAMLLRGRLVESFKSQSPPLTLICGAAGYGKTVLAAQLVQRADFNIVVWVQLPDIDVSGDFVLRQVADALDPRHMQGEDIITETVRSPQSVALDDSVRIRESLQRHLGSSVLLIVDGANGLSALEVLTGLATDLGRCTSPDSRVVASCRRIEHEGSIDPGVVWLVEEDDLAFTMSEVRALLSGTCSVDAEGDACRLFESYSGHPAITRIMLRHGIPASDARPRDLMWQTERIVSRLGEAEIAALYLAAVLGGGELGALHGCALACDLSVDWMALSRSVPLFHVLGTETVSRSFKVHAILCNVLDRLARTAVIEEDRDSIRAIAFDRLSRDQDYVRLASALELHGTESEVARWCGHDGVSMIRHVGHSAVARLLARLSPLSVASSARLLLLRAHVQRAGGAQCAALDSAMMARRVAEITGDHCNLGAATMLIARLQFDQGLIQESRRVLEEIESQRHTYDSVPIRCLTQAFLAVCDGQAGRLHEAKARADTLIQLTKSLDQGSDEAVFVANCLGAVACHCTGDWRAVAATLAPISRRSDVAPLQQAHVRSNYAVALFELGDVREAQSRAETVAAMCEELGIGSVLPYAMATLADVLYVGADVDRGREANAAAIQGFERAADHFGLASHGVNSARALRALGEHEESLSCAASAESLLATHGASAHMLRLMASIEVAASYLALGDLSFASSAVERVLADPVITEALGHRLRCDLLRAEMDRIRGNWRAAVERLAGYSEYISGDSANMTLVCYVRAFPGLLGILDQALGDAGVPARVARLLPGTTIADALKCARESAGPDSAAEMKCRYNFAESNASCAADEVPGPTVDSPFLQVRAFGKLEIESSYGCVEHRHWRKRKARLLFLMLLCAPAHEIPRDVILERLWPDMARANAQRNLYVTWSHLRKALACEADQADIAQFAGSNADAYWLTSLLRSDLDQFHAELGVLHVARATGDGAAVVASATRIAELYRGELLPIDIYEEWFEEDRTRARRDFCDAMVAGAQSAADAQQYDSALVLLKRVSAIDPWREDVYQLMMRCQMFVGQRSGAIETYNVCRTRLVDDLGIDPCAETVRIFQAVLAMEEDGQFASSSEN